MLPIREKGENLGWGVWGTEVSFVVVVLFGCNCLLIQSLL